METKDNYYRVSYNGEKLESDNLIQKITDSGWVCPDTILVNCFPEYSSRLTYLLNHKLSYLNNNELFEVIDLKMPYPTMVQVWDWDDLMYKLYAKYLADWIRKYIRQENRYLFIGADVYEESFTKLRSLLKGKLESNDYRFATLYKPKGSGFLPDYFVEEYEGKLLFQWQNVDNPNM